MKLRSHSVEVASIVVSQTALLLREPTGRGKQSRQGREGEGGKGNLTRERAVKGLFPCMASHVRTECVAAGVCLAFPRTVGPFAGVFLLSATDMLVVNVLDQVVHISEIFKIASLPSTHGDLVIALAAVVLVLVCPYERQRAG